MSKKILIVDDEDHIRFLLSQVLEDLEDEGVEVLMASDGQEAVEVIEAESPDLVFLDVMMPRMNGYEACHKVKKEAAVPCSSHVIILTASGQGLDKEKGVAAGADAFMTKPFDPEAILSRAREVLQMPE